MKHKIDVRNEEVFGGTIEHVFSTNPECKIFKVNFQVVRGQWKSVATYHDSSLEADKTARDMLKNLNCPDLKPVVSIHNITVQEWLMATRGMTIDEWLVADEVLESPLSEVDKFISKLKRDALQTINNPKSDSWDRHLAIEGLETFSKLEYMRTLMKKDRTSAAEVEFDLSKVVREAIKGCTPKTAC